MENKRKEQTKRMENYNSSFEEEKMLENDFKTNVNHKNPLKNTINTINELDVSEWKQKLKYSKNELQIVVLDEILNNLQILHKDPNKSAIAIDLNTKNALVKGIYANEILALIHNEKNIQNSSMNTKYKKATFLLIDCEPETIPKLRISKKCSQRNNKLGVALQQKSVQVEIKNLSVENKFLLKVAVLMQVSEELNFNYFKYFGVYHELYRIHKKNNISLIIKNCLSQKIKKGKSLMLLINMLILNLKQDADILGVNLFWKIIRNLSTFMSMHNNNKNFKNKQILKLILEFIKCTNYTTFEDHMKTFELFLDSSIEPSELVNLFFLREGKSTETLIYENDKNTVEFRIFQICSPVFGRLNESLIEKIFNLVFTNLKIPTHEIKTKNLIRTLECIFFLNNPNKDYYIENVMNFLKLLMKNYAFEDIKKIIKIIFKSKIQKQNLFLFAVVSRQKLYCKHTSQKKSIDESKVTESSNGKYIKEKKIASLLEDIMSNYFVKQVITDFDFDSLSFFGKYIKADSFDWILEKFDFVKDIFDDKMKSLLSNENGFWMNFSELWKLPFFRNKIRNPEPKIRDFSLTNCLKKAFCKSLKKGNNKIDSFIKVLHSEMDFAGFDSFCDKFREMIHDRVESLDQLEQYLQLIFRFGSHFESKRDLIPKPAKLPKKTDFTNHREICQEQITKLFKKKDIVFIVDLITFILENEKAPDFLKNYLITFKLEAFDLTTKWLDIEFWKLIFKNKFEFKVKNQIIQSGLQKLILQMDTESGRSRNQGDRENVLNIQKLIRISLDTQFTKNYFHSKSQSNLGFLSHFLEKKKREYERFLDPKVATDLEKKEINSLSSQTANQAKQKHLNKRFWQFLHFWENDKSFQIFKEILMMMQNPVATQKLENISMDPVIHFFNLKEHLNQRSFSFTEMIILENLGYEKYGERTNLLVAPESQKIDFTVYGKCQSKLKSLNKKLSFIGFVTSNETMISISDSNSVEQAKQIIENSLDNDDILSVKMTANVNEDYFICQEISKWSVFRNFLKILLLFEQKVRIDDIETEGTQKYNLLLQVSSMKELDFADRNDGRKSTL